MSAYVLDTSALMALIEDEDGAPEVATLVSEALDGDADLMVSVVASIELFYVSWQEQGRATALERLRLIGDLPVGQEPLDEQLIAVVGEIKASTPISLADCCIAGLAKLKNAALVHKDPEFEKLGDEVKQIKLPYKRVSGRP